MMHDIVACNLFPSSDFIFGFSDLHGLIDKKFDGFNYGISIGKRLDDKIIDGIENGPTLEYYTYYNLINSELADLASVIQSDLLRVGITSIIIEPTVYANAEEFDKYLETLTVEVSHKMLATRAGLGWIGKTDLFISKAFGPRLRLLSILIDQKPEINPVPVEKSKCGECAICVSKCPANAANGKSWNIHVQRNEFFDAHKCRQKCGEFGRQLLNEDKRICGICVSVCPIGKQKY